MPGKYSITLGLDIGGALSASERMIAKQKQIGDAAKAAAEAAEASSAKTAKAMTAMGMVAAQAIAKVARDVLSAVGDAQKAAEGKAAAMADKFSGTRGSLRELATLNNRPADAAFALEFAQKNVRTGLTPSEAIAFESQARNSMAQYIGTHASATMTENSAARFIERSATLGVSRGLDPNVSGDLAGVVGGAKNWQKLYGDRASSEALAQEARVLKILDQGRGQAKILADEFVQFSAAALGTKEGMAQFTSQEDIATSVSLNAQANPGTAAKSGMATMRALSEYDNPLIAKAGIKPGMTFFERMDRLRPVVEAEAKSRGVAIDDVLEKSSTNKGGFEDNMATRTLALGIRQGKQVFQQRNEAVAGIDALSAEQGVDAFQMTKEGIARRRAAEGEVVDVKKGIVSEDLTILRREAINQLRASGQLDTTTSEFQATIASRLTGGIVPDATQHMINEQVRKNVNVRSPQGVADVGEFQWLGGNAPTEENFQALMNRAIQQSSAAGTNVLMSAGEQEAQRRAIEENTRMLRGGALPSEPAMAGAQR